MEVPKLEELREALAQLNSHRGDIESAIEKLPKGDLRDLAQALTRKVFEQTAEFEGMREEAQGQLQGMIDEARNNLAEANRIKEEADRLAANPPKPAEAEPPLIDEKFGETMRERLQARYADRPGPEVAPEFSDWAYSVMSTMSSGLASRPDQPAAGQTEAAFAQQAEQWSRWVRDSFSATGVDPRTLSASSTQSLLASSWSGWLEPGSVGGDLHKPLAENDPTPPASDESVQRWKDVLE
ncbi:hypothetical protein Pan216_36580 [Planctomycetes bacterium Pan216]|uniref:Uncharacterized protein n=1 Tax=Kolteria novifilia TaxID=2527975 RepID=A0A518B731_9BACT|nr:hypothetical protein Pan216_36580 [Planctomycetes bacterium Pan216]